MNAFFLPAPHGGERFCIFHSPTQSPVRGCVLQVHPFAEEMNKCRRMAARQARALADAGLAVLQIDLKGCGDSSGDFSDATWSDWLLDLDLAARWLLKRHDTPLCWWGIRVGALAAVQAAERLGLPASFMFWQPTLRGASALQQFLRLKIAATMDQGVPATQASMREQLQRGEPIDVAGYLLNPALAEGLSGSNLRPPNCPPGRVAWLEVNGQDARELLPGSFQSIEIWRQAGFDVNEQVVSGPAFWNTTEVQEVEALLLASVHALCRETRP